MIDTVEKIEQSITELPQEQLEKFRNWYEKFDAKTWDKQLEDDIKSGKLDALAQMAIKEHSLGKSKKL